MTASSQLMVENSVVGNNNRVCAVEVPIFMPVEFECPKCKGHICERWELNGSNLGIRLMYWHYLLNPGIAFNELILGQRIPQQTYVCQNCTLPKVDRSYVHCPSCGIFHPSRIWSYKNAFGNWLGYVCPSCGAQIPCSWNLTSLVLLILTAPIWWLPVKYHKAKWLEQQYKRITQTQNAYIDKESNTPKPINYLRMGLLWGAFMFVTFTILFPTISLLGSGQFNWDTLIRKIISAGCIGLVIWPLAGVGCGASMQLMLDTKGGQSTGRTALLPKLLLCLSLVPILAVLLIVVYSVWAINAMKAGDKTPQKQAVYICDLALTVNPRWSAAYNLRGDLYQELEQKNKAIDNYTKAIAVNPESSYAYAARGNLYLDLKDYKKALDDSNIAVSINDQSFYAHCCRGQAYEHMKNYSKAIDDFTKTITIDPKGGCYLERAYAYGEIGQYQKAVNDCNTAINLNLKSAEAYVSRGNIYVKMGQPKQAITDYTQAIALDPKYGDSYYQRAEAYEKLGLKELSAKDRMMVSQLGYKHEES